VISIIITIIISVMIAVFELLIMLITIIVTTIIVSNIAITSIAFIIVTLAAAPSLNFEEETAVSQVMIAARKVIAVEL